jgi:hypothetical protein
VDGETWVCTGGSVSSARIGLTTKNQFPHEGGVDRVTVVR